MIYSFIHFLLLVHLFVPLPGVSKEWRSFICVLKTQFIWYAENDLFDWLHSCHLSGERVQEILRNRLQGKRY